VGFNWVQLRVNYHEAHNRNTVFYYPVRFFPFCPGHYEFNAQFILIGYGRYIDQKAKRNFLRIKPIRELKGNGSELGLALADENAISINV